MAFSYPNASIVVATLNNANVLKRVLHSMKELEYPKKFEVIVVNDGSTDATKEMLAKENGISVINFESNQGVCKARNAGIKAARFPIVVNMDHDCIADKAWLLNLVSGFRDPAVGAVSSFGSFGGTSTAFRKELLDKVRGYDEDYFYYREDTDLTFKIMELGFKYKVVKADYLHDHKEVAPRGLFQTVKYVVKRLRYHENDVLLYKKHPKLAADFLDVKAGFIVNPVKDFQVVTNLWEGSSKELKLCSPRGIELIKNKTPLHAVAIVGLGFLYVLGVKLFRLWGSIKFRKLLI